ncbi:hypothetical protein, partial [Candidatus Electronema sp. JM]|uniref:hypothetical protein n=1 Tax=Candidatus Electronema sp. JM TaxID=3401571 RepID=UPI003AA9964A
DCGKDIFACFKPHCRRFFQKISGRSSFVRQAANLWQVKSAVQKRLTMISGEINDPVCVITRQDWIDASQERLISDACVAKEMRCYGFKLGLRASRFGMIIHYSIIPTRHHDMQNIETLLE